MSEHKEYMMQRLTAFLMATSPLFLAGAIGHANPVRVFTYTPTFDGTPWTIQEDDGGSDTNLGPDDIVRNYDNYSAPTVFSNRIRTSDREFGDDLQLAKWHPGYVANIGFSIVNFSSSTINNLRVTFRFYNADGQLVYSERSSPLFVNMPAGFAYLISSDGAAWLPAQIPTSRNMYLSIQFSDVVGASIDDVGMLYGGPIGIGNSSRFIYDFTNNQQIDLGESPQANLGFFLYSVPAPGATTLVFVGLVPLARRRRDSQPMAR
ncbi:MAG: hypothetical protein SFZ23_04240 [Planctomycetota bacterium]|nr:hypothetical protein [Planctomycetota bacterium]